MAAREYVVRANDADLEKGHFASDRYAAVSRGIDKTRSTRLALLATLCLLLAWAPPALALDDWVFEVGTVTDNTTRGVDFSDHRPSVYAGATWYSGNGPFAGLSVSSVRFPGSSQGLGTVTNVGYEWRFEQDWAARVMLADYRFAHVPLANRLDYDEFVLTTGWREALYASISLSPNTGFGTTPKSRAIAYDLVGRFPMRYGFSAIAGIGYGDVRAELGSAVIYGDAGLSYQYRSLQLSLLYIATRTSAQAEAQSGSLLVNRWVAGATWHF